VSAFVTPKTTMNERIAARDSGKDAALHSDHRADECVHDDEQGELREVLA
jgi:hypothetical protein